MSDSNEVDYGPLAALIGVWKGDKGTDIAPEPEGTEVNPYLETLSFSAIGDVTNAGTQTLAVLHYRQIVRRKSDQQVFHDESGYWMWDAASQTIMHSLTIPRGVCILAGGHAPSASDKCITLEVAAAADHPDWHIIQSPFMREKACTTAFRHHITVDGNTLHYVETTMLDIYGKAFEHRDENTLTRH